MKRDDAWDTRAIYLSMIRNLIWALFLCSLALASSSCGGTSDRSGSSEDWDKIRFDLSRLDSEGLFDAANGKKSLHYEFCIPSDVHFVRQVEKIDPTIIVSPAPGRVGCGDGQYLCIGTTEQEVFRDVLLELARLDFVDRIEESLFE